MSLVTRARNRAFHWWFLLVRPMTLGARVALFCDGQVFLIRHTYVPGWQLPGGGVDRGETIEQAARRELEEEAGYRAGRLHLFALYQNKQASPRDHVALYRCDDAEAIAGFRADPREIADAGFFALDALPQDTSAATRRRLSELAGQAEPAPHW